MAWRTVAGSVVREPFARLTVVMVQWPVSVMACWHVEVAHGFVEEFMLRIPPVLLGDALLSVDVQLLQVCPDVGYLRSAVVYVAARLQGVRVGKGRQLLLRMRKIREHVFEGCGWLGVLSVGLVFQAAGYGSCAHGCEHVGGVWLVAPGAVYGPVVLRPSLFVV